MRHDLTPERFYKLAVLVPVGVPAILAPAWFGISGPEPFAKWLGLFAYFSFWTVLVGGLPYVVFAAFVLWRFWRKPAVAYRRFSYVVPLVFAPFLTVCIFVGSLLSGPFTPIDKLTVAATFGAIAVPVGYVYVLLIHLVRLGATRAGLILPESSISGL